MEKILTILYAARALDEIEITIAACMMIDTAAKKNGKTPREFIEDVAPVIGEIYAAMGFEGI